MPVASAARRSARFERLLLPGVAMRIGLLLGKAGTTLTASERVLEITESATTVAFGSYVAPMRDRMTIFFCGPLFFLSIFMMSSSFATESERAAGRLAILGSDSDTGRLYAFKQRVRRPTATWLSTPSWRATSASRIMPTETHSPCSIAGVRTASMAWPIV